MSKFVSEYPDVWEIRNWIDDINYLFDGEPSAPHSVPSVDERMDFVGALIEDGVNEIVAHIALGVDTLFFPVCDRYEDGRVHVITTDHPIRGDDLIALEALIKSGEEAGNMDA